MEKKLECSGGTGDCCSSNVTYIDDKGFIYCEQHGKQRQNYRRCRKLSSAELTTLKGGKPLKSY